MFVVIYTHGPAWQTGKTVSEQPFYREHGRYMKQFFMARKLLMGGAFVDNQGGLGILDVASEAQAREIVAHDPAVLERAFEPHLHLWHAYFNQYQAQSAPSGKSPSSEKEVLP
ncbi:YciI family protein [Ktedonobacter racemifer]|uniref:YCII-related protein n=1 Tax=Ktedonobacter racemifer DSM 44963 TaxID=485913 RepID=D6U8V4_KTERA|nr:YciI family protein [Ktedonobacter racemifer]EFH79562.1 YCII-related protein [Ktedonobacter racemifer DSM 44963]